MKKGNEFNNTNKQRKNHTLTHNKGDYKKEGIKQNRNKAKTMNDNINHYKKEYTHKHKYIG